MRLSADLFRWGLAVLLMVPFLAVGGWALGLSALLWLALVAIVLGAVLNVAAAVRGVRRVSDGRAVDEFFRAIDGPDAASSPRLEPRQRLIFPDGYDDPHGNTADRIPHRARAGLGSALGLLALVVAGALIAAVAIPSAMAGGALSLAQIYATWGTIQIVFVTGLALWSVAGLALAVLAWIAGRADGPVVRRIASPRRILALACIAGAALVVGWFAPAALPGLADALGHDATGERAATWRSGFGTLGVALCCVAIVLTVPRWHRRRSA
jgi:hypothetical protein